MRQIAGVLITFALISLVSGCSSRYTPSQTAEVTVQDRAPEDSGINPDQISDAVPRLEPRSATGNSPYRVYGVRYIPMPEARGYTERGVASWYGTKFHGRRTSSGEPYDMYKMTAAHRTLPLPSYVRVENMNNGRSIVVRVNDRGPFSNDRIIDLSYVAALKLGMVDNGTAPVVVTALDPSSTLAAGGVGESNVVQGGGQIQSVDLAPSGSSGTVGQVVGGAAAATGYGGANSASTGSHSGQTGWTTHSGTAITQGQVVGESGQAGASYGTNASSVQYGGSVQYGSSGQTGGTVQYGQQGSTNYGSGQVQLPAQTAGTTVIQSGSVVGVSVAAGGLIYIQVGAFGDYNNALRMQDRLGRQGFGPVVVVPAASNGRTVYRVRIGPLPSAAIANSELVRVHGAKRGLGLSASANPRVVYE